MFSQGTPMLLGGDEFGNGQTGNKISLQRGTYYINVESDRSPGVNTGIRVLVKRATGSGLPFILGGILALGLGVLLTFIGENKSS